MVVRAIKDSFVKLSPKVQAENPVMLLVYISAIFDFFTLGSIT
mgnify:FL=1